MKRKPVLLAALLMLAMTAGSASSSVELLENGGFEGGLSGWDHSLNVTASAIHYGVYPNSGNYMAVLSPGGWFDAELGQDFSTSGYTSAVVSFAYNLQAFDYLPGCDFGTDSLTISIGSYTLLTVHLNDLFGGGSTILGWNTFSGEISPFWEGNFTIRFDVENFPPGGGDWGQLFAAYIDDVSIRGIPSGATPVPEPSTLLLLGSGLVGVAHFGRRKFKK